jgi:TetR/AcrR family transcriptional regulator
MAKKEGAPARRRSFHTKTFENIDEARRDFILGVAIKEFADKGFNGTSINGLARKAKVSIGSLYSYFHSKDELFLTVCAKGHDLLEHALADIDPEAGLFSTYRTMLTRARDYARSNPELNLIYLDATTQGLRHLARRLSGNLESVTASLYRRVLEAAVRKGEVRAGIDIGAAAFCLDNLIVLFQFSFCSDYYRDRLRIFLGLAENEEIDENGLIEAMLDFTRAAMKA